MQFVWLHIVIVNPAAEPGKRRLKSWFSCGVRASRISKRRTTTYYCARAGLQELQQELRMNPTFVAKIGLKIESIKRNFLLISLCFVNKPFLINFGTVHYIMILRRRKSLEQYQTLDSKTSEL